MSMMDLKTVRLGLAPATDKASFFGEFLDMKLVYRFKIDDCTWGKINDYNEENNFSLVELAAAATKNLMDEIEIRPIAEVLNFSSDFLKNVVVVSTKDCVFGAAAMALPPIQKRIYRMLDGNYYVLPSSVHEVICLPAADFPETSELIALVKEVNNSTVAPRDKLSDSVYLCTISPAGEPEFTICDEN